MHLALGPLSSMKSTGFAAAFVQWDECSQHRFLFFFVFFFFFFACGRLVPSFFGLKSFDFPTTLFFVHLLLLPFWIVFDHQKRLQDIVGKTNGMAEFFVDDVFLLFLLCFFGCCGLFAPFFSHCVLHIVAPARV